MIEKIVKFQCGKDILIGYADQARKASEIFGAETETDDDHEEENAIRDLPGKTHRRIILMANVIRTAQVLGLGQKIWISLCFNWANTYIFPSRESSVYI